MSEQHGGPTPGPGDGTGPIERAQGNNRVFADRYRLLARRGRATDVALFEAVDDATGRTVAVKIVHPEICARPGFDERFHDTMARVAAVRHPNLTEVIDVSTATWGGRAVHYVVCENLVGGSLRDLRDRGRLLSASQAVMIGLEACRGLDAAHRAGLVHGDVRPNTLVFGDDGRLRVVDLGLAAVVNEAWWDDPAGVEIEKAKYASPEQARRDDPAAKSDVYSLCLCLLESVTGHLPFVGESSVATLANRVDKLLPVSADLGPLAAVLERAGRPDPGDRSSAAEFGRALHQAAERLPRPAPLQLLSGGLAAAPDATAPGGLRRPAAPVGDAETVAEAVADAVAPAAPAEVSPAEASSARAVATDGAAAPVDGHPPAPGTALAPGSTPVPDAPVDDMAAATTVVLPTPPPAATTHTDAGAAASLDALAAVPDAPPAAMPTELVTELVTGLVPERAPVAPASPEPPVTPATPATPVPTTVVPQVERPGHALDEPVLYDDRPERRRRWPLVLAVLVLLAAATAGAVWWFGRTVTHEVPDLAGFEQGVALNMVSEYHWQIATVDQADDTVEPGVVIRTDPPAGSTLAEQSVLTMVVSTGPAPRTLPELAGRTVDDATAALDDLGLVLSVGDQPFSEDVPEGQIVSWQVPDQPALVAGDTVLPGTTIVVSVSAGPAPRTVPDLTGATVDSATATLAEQGLVITVLPDEFSPTVPIGGIARQDPAAGSEVPKGATVSVAPSKGPDLVAVPSLANLTVDEARAALEAAGLVLGQVKGDPTGVNVLAEVAGQSIGGGAVFPRGTAIDLTFEVPTPPSTEPPPA
ncbi:MAG: PASTA domain-containing protein [Acidimicrobiales bacterium]